jgi:putative pyruvate formate lyase activating enzyme
MTNGHIDLPPNVLALQDMIRDCTLCPRQCHVDRTAGQVGACRIGAKAVVASFGPHFGEEPVLVGQGGSGTIFFAGCNLDCVFCQNADISHSDRGQRVSGEMLARIMLSLQADGCENVNVVTPTHVSHAVAEAVVIARAGELTRPIVYNCGGYESLDTLKLLDGLVDIYMPDFKYANAASGKTYSGVADYPQVARDGLAEMHRQVGPLQTDSCGVATRGVLVRHLVLPGDLADSRRVIDIVAQTAPGCAINVMAQYRPCFRADEFDELQAYPLREEIMSLRKQATDNGLAPVD